MIQIWFMIILLALIAILIAKSTLFCRAKYDSAQSELHSRIRYETTARLESELKKVNDDEELFL